MPADHAVPAAPRPTVAVAGFRSRFPVRRIFCVGRNYPEHAREMGASDVRAPPFFFTKPADAVIESGAAVPFPPRTANLHHEIELVVALGASAGIFGYAVGNDLTRRDVQARMKQDGKPWDTAKGFDHSAPISPIVPAAGKTHPSKGRIWLEVNDQPRQQGDIADMIWSVPHPTAGELRLVGSPLKLSDTPVSCRTHPPLVGEHTEEVLTSLLSYSDDAVRRLRAERVI